MKIYVLILENVYLCIIIVNKIEEIKFSAIYLQFFSLEKQHFKNIYLIRAMWK